MQGLLTGSIDFPIDGSERYKPFGDVSELFAVKCPQWALTGRIEKQILFRSECPQFISLLLLGIASSLDSTHPPLAKRRVQALYSRPSEARRGEYVGACKRLLQPTGPRALIARDLNRSLGQYAPHCPLNSDHDAPARS